MNSNTRYLILVLLVAITLIALIPFFKIGFTTADDFEYYFTARLGDYWENAHIYAQSAGRFFFYITKPLYSVPYLVDNFIYTKVIQYSSLVFSYSCFAYFAYKIFKSKEFGVITFVLLVIGTTITPNYHTPFIAYPFYFTFSFSLIILSAILFLSYQETNKMRSFNLSIFLLTIGLLFYETHLLFVGFICFYILFSHIRKSGIRHTFNSKLFYKEFMPYVSVGIVYVLIYFVFRIFASNPYSPDGEFYSGSSFASNFSFENFFKIIGNLTVTAIPGVVTDRMANEIAYNTLLHKGHLPTFWHILTNASPLAYITAFVQTALVVLMLRIEKERIEWKSISFGVVFSLFAAFVVHSFIAFADKYNASWYSWLEGYVTTYYSYFGVMLALAIIMYSFYKLFSRVKLLKPLALIVPVCMIVFISITASYTNQWLSREWDRGQNRIRMLDEMIKKSAFSKIPENAIIYLETLNGTGALFCGIDQGSANIGTYIKLKTGKNFKTIIRFANLKQVVLNNPEAEVFLLTKNETEKTDEMLLTVANVNREAVLSYNSRDSLMLNIKSNRIALHFYSPAKRFLVGYRASQNGIAVINSSDTLFQTLGANVVNISSRNGNTKIVSLEIEGPEILVGSFFASAMKDVYLPSVLVE